MLFFCFFVFLPVCLSKPETAMVIIDSNVSAFIYQGDKRIGETPFAGKLPRSEIGDLSLKRSGYKTVKLPVKKVYGRSTPFITGLYTDMTSSRGGAENASKEDILAMTTLMPSLPLFIMTDATVF